MHNKDIFKAIDHTIKKNKKIGQWFQYINTHRGEQSKFRVKVWKINYNLHLN